MACNGVRLRLSISFLCFVRCRNNLLAVPVTFDWNRFWHEFDYLFNGRKRAKASCYGMRKMKEKLVCVMYFPDGWHWEQLFVQEKYRCAIIHIHKCKYNCENSSVFPGEHFSGPREQSISRTNRTPGWAQRFPSHTHPASFLTNIARRVTMSCWPTRERRSHPALVKRVNKHNHDGMTEDKAPNPN